MKDYKITYETSHKEICDVKLKALDMKGARKSVLTNYRDVNRIHIIQQS